MPFFRAIQRSRKVFPSDSVLISATSLSRAARSLSAALSSAAGEKSFSLGTVYATCVFRPFGAGLNYFSFTHGLRRGLYSFAATRLTVGVSAFTVIPREQAIRSRIAAQSRDRLSPCNYRFLARSRRALRGYERLGMTT